MEKEFKELVALQASKIAVEFTIVDFTKMVLDAIEEGRFISNKAAEMFLEDLKNHYYEFVVELAEDKVFKYAKEIIEKREEVEDLNELEEIEPLEYEENEDDLKYVIQNDIYIKNVNIYNQDKYPESETENYWMIGIDINNVSEQELQEMSIFDRDFW